MDALADLSNLRAIRNALETLPTGMNSTYNEAMKRIARQGEHDKQLAERVLSWITYACRPLTVRELQHAMAVRPNTTYLDTEAIEDELILTSVCAGLVVVDKKGSTIRLVRK